MNVENRRGRSITTASSSRLITPRSPSRHRRSATSNAGSPKNAPAPASSRVRIDRSTTLTRCLRDAAVLLEHRFALVGREEP
jgi:hypothetical protein